MYNARTMSTISAALDQPYSLEYELLPEGAISRLANQEILCLADADSNALDVTWPWADALYARRISLAISDWQDGPLTPLVVRLFPGHQETIAGAEGMIVTKRLITPWKSPDDKALIWLLECQAEGDRLLRLEVQIDWGEPLSQRMVDGLLVAQRNPEPARGIYAQSNAESTRVFGNPYGRPDEVVLDDPQRARLVYHVLINGIVEVPLLLTVSDVGEQVAWNGFLSLRDVEQVFDASSMNWSRLLQAGRLWTPDAAFNHTIQDGKLEAVRRVQRARSGWTPSDGKVTSVVALVNAWDAIDPVVSRNLLAHLRRQAELHAGAMPELLSFTPQPQTNGSGAPAGPVHPATLTQSIDAYLSALALHLRHHGDEELAVAHLPTVRLCADRLIQLRAQQERAGDAWDAAACVRALRTAHLLALAAGNDTDAARWESEVNYLAQRAGVADTIAADSAVADSAAADSAAAETGPADEWPARVQAAGAAVWDGCGISYRQGELWVEPPAVGAGGWWALLSLPLTNGKHLSLLWDGSTLHATQPVRSPLAVALYKRIQIRHTDEFDFDPYFELTRDSQPGDTTAAQRFKPQFFSS